MQNFEQIFTVRIQGEVTCHRHFLYLTWNHIADIILSQIHCEALCLVQPKSHDHEVYPTQNKFLEMIIFKSFI